jgi:hypothetical protein
LHTPLVLCAMFVPSITVAQPGLRAPRLVIHAGGVLHRTTLVWSVGPSSEYKLSELSHRGLATYQGAAGAAFRIGPGDRAHWLIAGDATLGPLAGGDVQDSDFGDGTETSRIESEVTGRGVWSASVGAGRRWFNGHGGLLDNVSVWLGLEREEQSIRMQHGRWVISAQPDTSSLAALDSRYRARWTGLWMAVESDVAVGHGDLVARLVARFRSGYSGEGTWNLRTDLAQPRSFAQDAEGWGYEGQVSYTRPLLRPIGVTLWGRYVQRHAAGGSDTTFFADGRTARLTLLKVSSRSVGLGLELSAAF